MTIMTPEEEREARRQLPEEIRHADFNAAQWKLVAFGKRGYQMLQDVSDPEVLIIRPADEYLEDEAYLEVHKTPAGYGTRFRLVNPPRSRWITRNEAIRMLDRHEL